MSIELLLLNDVETLGKAGDLVRVAYSAGTLSLTEFRDASAGTAVSSLPVSSGSAVLSSVALSSWASVISALAFLPVSSGSAVLSSWRAVFSSFASLTVSSWLRTVCLPCVGRLLRTGCLFRTGRLLSARRLLLLRSCRYLGLHLLFLCYRSRLCLRRLLLAQRPLKGLGYRTAGSGRARLGSFLPRAHRTAGPSGRAKRIRHTALWPGPF